jgi:hypothetical protein
VQRHDGGGGEIGVLQLSARFVEHLTEQQRHEFQMRGQRFELRAGQGGEKMVLIRAVG